MKNLHKLVLGLMVGAMAVGFSSFTHAGNKVRKTSNTYYAVKSPDGFSWRIVNPNDYNCDAGGAACAPYVANSAPADNTIPAGYTKDNMELVP